MAYLVTFSVGQKVRGVAIPLGRARQDTRLPIPLCNVVGKLSHASGGITRSDTSVGEARIDRKHPLSPVVDVIVENDGLGWEARIAVDNVK